MEKTHTSKEYAAELQQVRDNLLSMADNVKEMIERAVHSLEQGDTKLAEEVIEQDHQVNRLEVDTDELCLLILAKRQPMATDLRFITIAMKMVTDLERIGDLAVNICERTIALSKQSDVEVPETIGAMSTAASGMVHTAIDAFVESDIKLARDVFEQDDEVDNLYTKIWKDMREQMVQGRDSLEQGIHLQAVAKFLERIGDHANNLAELVIFMVKGKDIRHVGKR